jgi:hypothetical protein
MDTGNGAHITTYSMLQMAGNRYHKFDVSEYQDQFKFRHLLHNSIKSL